MHPLGFPSGVYFRTPERSYNNIIKLYINDSNTPFSSYIVRIPQYLTSTIHIHSVPR